MMSRKAFVSLGITLLSLGIILNEKILGILFSPDRAFQSFSLRIRIITIQLLFLIAGYLCIKVRHAVVYDRKTIRSGIVGILLIVSGILINEWFVARLFGCYGVLARVGIWLINLDMIGVGGILLWRSSGKRTEKNTSRITDGLMCIFFIAFVFLFASKFVNFSALPNEDAAMLMRYADHLAKGYGIVWNIGDPPVDGATDFLFMVFVGWLAKTRLSVEFATQLLGFVAHLVTVELLYLILRKYMHMHRVLAVFSALYFAIGPGLYYVAAHFGTPFFALFGSLSWCFALIIITEKKSSYAIWTLFALASLITGMIRPEGVILAAFMLLAVISAKGFRQSFRQILWFSMVFGGIGGAYFFWRWHYFGFPLPNPFYIKGGGHLYFSSLTESLAIVYGLCLPCWPAFILGLRSAETWRKTCYALVPILGFSASFLLLSLETNFGDRFQYVVLPIVLLSWGPLVQGIRQDFHLPAFASFIPQHRLTLAVLAASLSIGALIYQHQRTQDIAQTLLLQDGRYAMARMLNAYRDHGFVLATTEAGLLPLYSQWYSIDTYGLNDQWIAHHGLHEEYLDQYKPHIIMFHEAFSLLFASDPSMHGGWYGMVMTLKIYAEKNQYILAAIFGDGPHDTHYYYVRHDFPESRELVEKIRNIAYDYFLTNRKSVNYANFQ